MYRICSGFHPPSEYHYPEPTKTHCYLQDNKCLSLSCLDRCTYLFNTYCFHLNMILSVTAWMNWIWISPRGIYRLTSDAMSWLCHWFLNNWVQSKWKLNMLKPCLNYKVRFSCRHVIYKEYQCFYLQFCMLVIVTTYKYLVPLVCCIYCILTTNIINLWVLSDKYLDQT